MGSEKLGTCDKGFVQGYHFGEHAQRASCVNFREQPRGEATPATAGTARAWKRYGLNSLITPFRMEPAVDGAWVRYEDVEACADHRVRPLQISLAKLYAAIGPMDELDTVDDAVARVEKLRQERDAAKKEITRLILQYTVSHDYWYDGDAHFDSPEEYADEQNLTVGEEFELTASSYWEEKFRVTKVPDEKNDDYECETISKQREEFETYQQMAEARERAEKALREATEEIELLRRRQ